MMIRPRASADSLVPQMVFPVSVKGNSSIPVVQAPDLESFALLSSSHTIFSPSNYILSNIFYLKEALFEIKYHSAFPQYSSKYIKDVINLLICNMMLTAYCDCGGLNKVNEGKAINGVSQI